MNLRLARRLLVAILCASCARDVNQSSRPDPAALVALEETKTRFLNAVINDDVAAIAATLSEDVTLILPSAQPVRGRIAALLWFETRHAKFRSATALVPEPHHDTDWANAWYDFTLTQTPNSGGEPLRYRGTVVWKWRHEPDGQWRVARNVWYAGKESPRR